MQSFRNPRPTDAARCFEIETSAYKGDEAATLEKIARRIANYPQGFLVLEVDGKMVAFVNSGCAHVVELSDEEFKDLIGHDPDAPNVVILSVVVDPAHQGQGYAGHLMREFLARMTKAGKRKVHLMCRAHHVPLYEGFGFRYVKPSASEHGGVPWHEMVLRL